MLSEKREEYPFPKHKEDRAMTTATKEFLTHLDQLCEERKAAIRAAAEAFWAWFAEKEEWITATLGTPNGSDVVWAIDAQIKPVFPYFKKELEFQLGFNEGKGEFFFFHFGNKHLMRDGQAWAELMPADLKARWTVILEK